jgi:hypothetical protein
MRAGEREVSADAISRAKDYQVATHQLACVDDPELAVSAYAGAHREQRLPPRSGHPLLLPSVLTVALPSGLAAWLAWRRSTWAPVAVIDIAAPAEEIFDVIVDARNEPRWNPKNAPSADAHSRACRRGYDVSGGVRSGGGRGVDRGHEDRPSPLMDGDKPVTSP